jgi:hypothetical protein
MKEIINRPRKGHKKRKLKLWAQKKTMSKGARIATLVSSIILMLAGLFMLGLTYEKPFGALWLVIFSAILVVVNIYKLATDYNKDPEDNSREQD